MNEHVLEEIDPVEVQREADARDAAEHDPRHRRSVAITSAVSVVAVIVGVSLLGVVAPDRSGPTPPPTTPTPVDDRDVGRIKVPSLVGLVQEEAVTRVLAAGLAVRVRESDSCEPARTVISQDPKAAERVDRGIRVDLVVASASGAGVCPTKYTVPRADREVATRFVEFARTGESASPLAAAVGLGLGDRMYKIISQRDALDPASWGLCAAYAGLDCPLSALTVLTEWNGSTRTDAGPAPVCGVPHTQPDELVGQQPLSIVPVSGDHAGCEQWSIDLYVSDGHRITDVVLRLGTR